MKQNQTSTKQLPWLLLLNPSCMGGYTWTDFIHEYWLNIEISYIIEAPSKKRLYFIHVGSFEKAGSPSTIWDQVWASMKFKYHTLRDHQMEFIAALGKDLPVLLSTPINVQIKKNNTTENIQRGDDEEQGSDSSSSINMKNITNVHFFEKILKQGVDVDRIWSFIDEKKLMSGINELIWAVQKNSHDVETTCLLQVDKSMKVTVVDADV
jgi:hypothetical protein